MRISTILIIGIITWSLHASDKFSQPLTDRLQQLSENETVAVWVFFTDKGPDIAVKLHQAEQQLLRKAVERRARHAGDGELLVDFYDIPLEKKYLDYVKKHSKKIRQKSRWLNAVSVEITPAGARIMAEADFIRKMKLVFIKNEPLPFYESNTVMNSSSGSATQNFNYGPSLDQNQQINVVELHNLGYDGSGVLVAMLDAGFNNLQHEALQHLNILHTYDFVNGDSIVWNEPGQMGNGNHGTYTLSTLAGFKQGRLIGPAFGAQFVLAKTENTDWERHVEEDAWIAGAEWADSLGADIISSSLGYLNGFTNGDTNYTWQNMDGNTTLVTIGADLAASRGILVVNSAGNEGAAAPGENTLIAPSDGDSVLAVGSVTATGLRSSFSSMGPTADGRIKPDVMARGSATLCASPYDTSGYLQLNGTSLSCPLVAGAAALVLQANPQYTNMDIIQALKGTSSNALAANNAYGWGIINAFDAADVLTDVNTQSLTVPGSPVLHANYPNPFNPVTTVSFDLPEQGTVQIAVYNLLGEKVTDLVNNRLPAGTHHVTWDAGKSGTGMYYIVMQFQQQRLVQKALLIK